MKYKMVAGSGAGRTISLWNNESAMFHEYTRLLNTGVKPVITCPVTGTEINPFSRCAVEPYYGIVHISKDSGDYGKDHRIVPAVGLSREDCIHSALMSMSISKEVMQYSENEYEEEVLGSVVSYVITEVTKVPMCHIHSGILEYIPFALGLESDITFVKVEEK